MAKIIYVKRNGDEAVFSDYADGSGNMTTVALISAKVIVGREIMDGEVVGLKLTAIRASKPNKVRG